MSRVIRGRKIYNKRNNDDINRKGFTLVEVLAVVVIISVVLGIGFVIYNSVMNNSKEKASVIAVNNIVEAAKLYGKEYENVKWLNNYGTSSSDDVLEVKEEYVCITVNELVNSGYFNSDFYKRDIYEKAEITGNTYVRIVRGVDNKANLQINVLKGNLNRNQCELSDGDIEITGKKTYTDTIEFEYKDKYESSGYSYYFKQFSDNVIKGSGTLSDGEGDLTFVGLKNNTKYVLSICSVYDDVKSCSHKDVYTADFINSSIKVSDFDKWSQTKEVTIGFKDENIKGENGRHYFYSEVEANVVESSNNDNPKVVVCNEDLENLKNCNDINDGSIVTKIESGKWYYTMDEEIALEVAKELDKEHKNIYVKVLDQTGNESDIVDNFVNKIDKTGPVITFVTNGNLTADESQSSIVNVKDELNGTVSKLKYVWSKSNNSSASSGTSFTNGDYISYSGVNGTYYLCIYAKDGVGNETNTCSNAFEFAQTYKISYDANGGSGVPSSQTYTYASSGTINLSSIIPTRTGYTFLGWSLSSTATSASYSAGQTWNKSNANNYTLYAVWSVNKVYVQFHMNGGTWAGSTNKSLSYSGKYVTKNGSTIVAAYSYGKTGINLANWDNSDYINISKTGYRAKSGYEWNSKADGSGTSYSDSSSTITAASLCDASRGNCTVTLYVNWILDTTVYYVTASSGLKCRSGPGTGYSRVTAYTCGTSIAGYKYNDSWIYYPAKDCYLSSSYLSTTKKSCSSSGSSSGYTGTCQCQITSNGNRTTTYDCDTHNLNSSSDCRTYCNQHHFTGSMVGSTC